MSEGGFNFGDLVGLSAPLEKLIETVSAAIGKPFNATFIRKDADAKAYELRQLGEAEAENIERKALAHANAMRTLSEGIRDSAPGTGGITIGESGPVLTSLPANEQDRLPNVGVAEIIARSERRQLYQNVVRQHNIESVTAVAAEQLEEETTVSGEPVDPDWSARFFRHVEDISNEEMQMIWGKILAGEIKSPNTYSFRTLDTLKALTPKEAELFTKYANRMVSGNDTSYHFVELDDLYEIPILDKAVMREAGLIHGGDPIVLSLNPEPGQKLSFAMESFGHVIEIKVDVIEKQLNIDLVQLTTAGSQIVKLINPSVNIEYLTAVAKAASSRGRNVRMGLVTERDHQGRPTKFSANDIWRQ